MNWLRLYHGTSTDPKLHKASRAAKVSRGLFLGAWVAVLEYASQQEPRGNVADLDAATLAYLIDSPPAVAARILAAMNVAGMIENGIIRAWAKRQRESDDVAERVRKHRMTKNSCGDTKDRENDGGANPLNGQTAPTSRNVTETRQNRTEQNREDKSLPAASESRDPRARAHEAAAAPDGFADLVDALHERTATAGVTRRGVERVVDGWVGQIGEPRTRTAVAEALACATGNPLKYAAAIVDRRSHALDVGKHAAGLPPPEEPDPFLEAMLRPSRTSTGSPRRIGHDD